MIKTSLSVYFDSSFGATKEPLVFGLFSARKPGPCLLLRSSLSENVLNALLQATGVSDKPGRADSDQPK